MGHVGGIVWGVWHRGRERGRERERERKRERERERETNLCSGSLGSMLGIAGVFFVVSQFVALARKFVTLVRERERERDLLRKLVTP